MDFLQVCFHDHISTIKDGLQWHKFIHRFNIYFIMTNHLFHSNNHIFYDIKSESFHDLAIHQLAEGVKGHCVVTPAKVESWQVFVGRQKVYCFIVTYSYILIPPYFNHIYINFLSYLSIRMKCLLSNDGMLSSLKTAMVSQLLEHLVLGFKILRKVFGVGALFR